jgi:osmotically-inducible protein OsmY
VKKSGAYVAAIAAAFLLAACGTNAAGNKPYDRDAAADTPAAVQPDNTGVNERDAENAQPTAGDQSESPADRDLTQQIRQAVMDDANLSVNAHNVKIITIGGRVTLRGPVKTEAEKTSIEAKAVALAGPGHVDNQIEIES